MPQQQSFRADRVNELIKRELVVLLSTGTKDPRLRSVVITDVNVSRDLTSAKVFSQWTMTQIRRLLTCSIRQVGFLDHLYQNL